MEYIVKGYQPESMFRFFEDISRIPRSSGKEQAVSDYLVEFAGARGLECVRDSLCNVLIRRPAAPGCEGKPGVLFQGHMDMVCEKNADVEHDFDSQPLDLYVQDGLLRARGTTLGADNGAAVAMMLALLDDKSLVCPPMECLFTVQEETALVGAAHFDGSLIRSSMMVNLDSEEDGVVTTSCAGGLRVKLIRAYVREAFEGVGLHLFVKGLLGGHSGMEIHQELGCANKLMGRVLYALSEEMDVRIQAIFGGNKDNAIPRECQCVAVVPQNSLPRALEIVRRVEEELRREYEETDPGVTVLAREVPVQKPPMSREDSRSIIRQMVLAPHGVLKTNPKAGGFVVASVNFGVIEMDEEKVVFHFSPRSSVESLQNETRHMLSVFGEVFGDRVEMGDGYPGWPYEPHSLLRETFCQVYEELYGVPPKTMAIHAGLECGLLKSKAPQLDIIAIGATVTGCHTPDEAMDLRSCENLWKQVTALLARLAQ
ncbi:MAG: aminoacyl-histidine dipeptidase [Oscillospiraceae bacterium]|nr:aminoacyl-histidine dipeptidase [Oscillospiraceae bacterium]